MKKNRLMMSLALLALLAIPTLAHAGGPDDLTEFTDPAGDTQLMMGIPNGESPGDVIEGPGVTEIPENPACAVDNGWGSGPGMTPPSIGTGWIDDHCDCHPKSHSGTATWTESCTTSGGYAGTRTNTRDWFQTRYKRGWGCSSAGKCNPEADPATYGVTVYGDCGAESAGEAIAQWVIDVSQMIADTVGN